MRRRCIVVRHPGGNVFQIALGWPPTPADTSIKKGIDVSLRRADRFG